MVMVGMKDLSVFCLIPKTRGMAHPRIHMQTWRVYKSRLALSPLLESFRLVAQLLLFYLEWILVEKYAFISNDPNSHCIEAMSWRISIRDCLPKVGLSPGISSSDGSKNPNTTNRALALRVLPSLACSSEDSIGFHV